MNNITLGKLTYYLDFFNKMYDAVRLVDPVEKRVVEYRGNLIEKMDEVCYDYWKDGKICENCISIRADLNSKCFMKLEKSDRAIMMVTALPIENAESPAVLELLKNATDTMMIGMGTYSDGHMMHDYIKELNEKIIKDGLTGLYNRRYVDERLPVDIIKSTIADHPLSVIFLDVDNLKEINDRYGHEFGDQTIKQIADVILQQIRVETDWAARYGGDEFFICLNNTPAHVSARISERIRTKIQDLVLSQEKKIRTTVSLGVYTMEAGTQLTAKELIKMADTQMYKAKQQGKNRSASVQNDL